MRGQVFRNDRASLHQAMETKEALNRVCVMVSGVTLQWPVSRPDIKRIEQM
jgi:hypothetical protein